MKIENSINSWKHKYIKFKKKTVTLPFKAVSKLLFRLEDRNCFDSHETENAKQINVFI